MHTLNKKFIPSTKEEIIERGWNYIDIILISGDAYIDHPSFGIPLLARFLEGSGYRVGIISQPSISVQNRYVSSEESINFLQKLGMPRLFVGISSGVVDSMLNNYTAFKKYRSDDMYSPGGLGGLRPDYAATEYSKIARLAFPNVPIIGGGIEVSLRRTAHYDYWKNRVMPSILKTSAFDLIVYGMAEKTILNIASELKKVSRDTNPRDIYWANRALTALKKERGICYLGSKEEAQQIENRLVLPSYEEVRDDKKKFLKSHLLTLNQINPHTAKTIVQYHENKAIIINPPPMPLTEGELDEIYNLPFTKEPHYSYKEKIPAAEMIKFSITANRGCFGGCSFCGLGLHQGKIIQSRSKKSILNEIERTTTLKGFTGNISDLGGPSANMYGLSCKNLELQKTCARTSCLFPTICNNLDTSQRPSTELLKQARGAKGIKRVFIASGVRLDLALKDRDYMEELIAHHVGGHLKVAPEHIDDYVLKLMQKPPFKVFEDFRKVFKDISDKHGKEQYLVPYFISSFPGSNDEKMKKLQDWLTAQNWKLQQVQGFIPLPMTLASAIYYTELHPVTLEKLFVAKNSKDKNSQRIALQSFRYKKKRR